MESKLSIVFLGFFALVAIAQGLTIQPGELKQYYPCFTKSVCSSDAGEKKVENCVKNTLKPNELKDAYKYVKDNKYPYKSDTFEGALKEYCGIKGDEQKNAYEKTLNGIMDFEKQTCANGQSGTCSRVAESLVCVYGFMRKQSKEGNC